MSDERSRRALLGACAGVLGGLAGCGGFQGDSGTPNTATTTAPDTTEPGTNNEPSSTPPTTVDEIPALSSRPPQYRRWQPGTGDIAGGLTAAYNIQWYRLSKPDLPAEAYERGVLWAMPPGDVGIRYSELTGILVGLGMPAWVLLSQVDRSTIVSRLRESPYTEAETSDGVTYFHWSGNELSEYLAVADEGVVLGRSVGGAADPAARFRDVAEMLIATRRGNRQRLHETDDAYRRYTDAVGWPLMATSRPLWPANAAGVGVGTGPGSVVRDEVGQSIRMGLARYLVEDVFIRRYWSVPTPDAPLDPEAVAAAFRQPDVQEQLAPENGTVEVYHEGDVVDIRLGEPVTNPGGGTDPVLANVTATLDGESFTVNHRGGDPIPLGYTRIRTPDQDRAVTVQDSLVAGDSRTFGVSETADSANFIFEFQASGQQVSLASAERTR